MLWQARPLSLPASAACMPHQLRHPLGSREAAWRHVLMCSFIILHPFAVDPNRSRILPSSQFFPDVYNAKHGPNAEANNDPYWWAGKQQGICTGTAGWPVVSTSSVPACSGSSTILHAPNQRSSPPLPLLSILPRRYRQHLQRPVSAGGPVRGVSGQLDRGCPL